MRTEKKCTFIVLTGGPGAGKTATLEVLRRKIIDHIAVLPEAAGIIYGGGFPRGDAVEVKKAGQCAIFHVQRELERAVAAEGSTSVALCDRGTLDGLAYWPNSEASFWSEFGTTREKEFARYSAVIHLRTPKAGHGYDKSNPIRIESAREAARIDDLIAKAWEGHPNRVVVESSENFLEKVKVALDELRKQLVRLGHPFEP